MNSAPSLPTAQQRDPYEMIRTSGGAVKQGGEDDLANGLLDYEARCD